jgi:hypothetical protein
MRKARGLEKPTYKNEIDKQLTMGGLRGIKIQEKES